MQMFIYRIYASDLADFTELRKRLTWASVSRHNLLFLKVSGAFLNPNSNSNDCTDAPPIGEGFPLI